MKVLWLCNMVPGKVRGNSGGLWVDHVLDDLSAMEDIQMRILCLGSSEKAGIMSDRVQYRIFTAGLPYQYRPELEKRLAEELKDFCPDVVHIWGTEYAHTLAMVNACRNAGLQNKITVSIQGLCSIIARHYSEGLPDSVRKGFTFRDFVRQDNIAQQVKKFTLRGALEVRALEQVGHVIGRTPMDEACTARINPDREYHFCNETLRAPFYEDRWQYSGCRKHRIFASSCVYPVKGFHYLLEAMPDILAAYPDATLAVPGKSFLKGSLRSTKYEKYLAALAKKAGAEDRIEFLGKLDAEQMKAAFLESNVFVLPSTIENSPNSLGEAMLLGLPCVAADVGGVSTMLKPQEEGFVYQSTAPYMLAHYVKRVFAMEDKAAAMGEKAAQHAEKTHDPVKNLADLLGIYETIAKGE